MTNIEVPASNKGRRFNWPRIFGYDFFISFKLGSPPIGAQLDTTLVKALKKSKILVVIANEGALVNSQWVREEVEEFRRKHPKRSVIPINVDKSIETFGSQADIAKWLKPEGSNPIMEDETKEAINQGISSPHIIERLQLAARFIKANTWFRGVVVAIILLLIGLSLWAGYSAWDANNKFIEATAIRLTVEGNAMSSGLQSGSQVLGMLKVLAGYRLVSGQSKGISGKLLDHLIEPAGDHRSALVSTYTGLQTAYNRLDHLLYSRTLSASVMDAPSARTADASSRGVKTLP
jgi:hypothetical protein